MKLIYLVIFFSCIFPYSWNQSAAKIHIDQSIFYLYNYNLDSAFYYLDLASSIDEEHPLIPFLFVTCSWIEKQVEGSFESSNIELKKMINEYIPIYEKYILKYDYNPEYYLYLGSLYGLKTRIEIVNNQWVGAFFSNKNTYRYIKRAHDLDENLNDTYLPLGLINYYTCISSNFIQFLSKISGIEIDCDKSIDYLEISSNDSYYSWIESNNMLSYIYLYMNGDYQLALDKVSPLVKKFPNHPFFPFIEAECLLYLNRISEFDSKYPNLERFANHPSNTIKNECSLKLSYLMALKKYLEGDYENSISYTSHVIDNYSMEFNWLLGLSYFLRGESLLKLNRINESKIDFKFVSKLDFKFPEKEKAKKILYSLREK